MVEMTMTATTSTLVIRALLPVIAMGKYGVPRQSIYGKLSMPQLYHNHGDPKAKPRKPYQRNPNLALGRDTIRFFLDAHPFSRVMRDRLGDKLGMDRERVSRYEPIKTQTKAWK